MWGCAFLKDLSLLVWLSQLGISVVAPLTLCTLGALWLRERYCLGTWVLILGIGLGLYLAVDGFRHSLKLMEARSRDRKQNEKTPPAPVSFNDHL